MDPYQVNPIAYQPLVDPSYYLTPAPAASPNPIVSLAAGVNDLFDNGLAIYASTLNRLRALDFINQDSKPKAPATTDDPTGGAQKTSNTLLLLILLAIAIGLFLWATNKK